MGLSDDPMPAQMKATHRVAVSQADLARESQAYHLRALSGFAYFIAVLLGILLGAASGIWLGPQWQRIFMAIGAIGLPMLLWKMNNNRAKKFERLDADKRYRVQEEQRKLTEKKIEEARMRGEFDRWNKDE